MQENKVIIYTTNDGKTKINVNLEEKLRAYTRADVRTVPNEQIECK